MIGSTAVSSKRPAPPPPTSKLPVSGFTPSPKYGLCPPPITVCIDLQQPKPGPAIDRYKLLCGVRLETIGYRTCKFGNYLRIRGGSRKLSANGRTLFANGVRRSVMLFEWLRPSMGPIVCPSRGSSDHLNIV